MSSQKNNPIDPASAHSAFVTFMSLSGSARQILKNRMQDKAEQGLGPIHLHALNLCFANPDSTQQQLVQSMGRDKGQIARLIRELEEREFLVRAPDEHDRRVWRLTVTPEGEKQCQWFSAIETGLAMDMFAGLDAKALDQLEQLFKQLRERIDLAPEKE